MPKRQRTQSGDAQGEVKQPEVKGGKKGVVKKKTKIKKKTGKQNIRCVDVEKRSYWRGAEPTVETDDLRCIREQLGITVSGVPVPPPLENFTDEGLCPEFHRFFSDAKGKECSEPTVIQKQAWPAVLCGADVVGIAPTGSGKTLAYLLPSMPFLNAVSGGKSGAHGSTYEGPTSLVLVPTRELAQQVCGPFRGRGGFTQLFNFRAMAIFGGTDREEQVASFRSEKPDLVVATPGRLLDVANSSLSLKGVRYLVFDEADRMLALGFEKQLDELAKLIARDRQTLMFSATFPLKVREAAERWLRPKKTVVIRVAGLEIVPGESTENRSGAAAQARIALDDDASAEEDNCTVTVPAATSGTAEKGGTLTVNPLVRQSVHVCASHKKPQKLLKILTRIRKEEREKSHRQKGPVVIFCNKIKTVRFVQDALKQIGERIACVHSKMPQSERENVLKEFRAGRSSVLVATDLAARGLHDKRLKYVVNYDFPSNLELYCHRIGRTGRCEEEGYAHSFFTRNFENLAPDLVSLLERTSNWVDPNLRQLVKAQGESDDDDDEQRKKKKKTRKKTQEPENDGLAVKRAKKESIGKSCKANDISSDDCEVSSKGLKIKPRKRSGSQSSDGNSDSDVPDNDLPEGKHTPEGQEENWKNENSSTNEAKRKRPRGKRGGAKHKKSSYNSWSGD